MGCGHARLLKFLGTVPFKSYLGVDISPEAIKQARVRAHPNARFEVGNIEEWDARGERFDVIVFNESLYYALRPVQTLQRYVDAQTEGGVLIVSIYRHKNRELLWRKLDKHFVTLDSTTVKNGKGMVWDVKVLQARALTRAPSTAA